MPRIDERYDFQNKLLEEYEFVMASVDGWVTPHDIRFLDFISSLPMNNEGGVCEIGVHVGQYFIPLNLLVESDFESVAVDLFDEGQKYNVSFSGGLEENDDQRSFFKKYCSVYDVKNGGDNIRIIDKDSLTLVPEDLGIRKFKFISVDGGHDKEHAENDLKLVERCITQEGVVILDDFYSDHFMGVTEGFFNYKSNGGSLVPFARCDEKLYLCNYSVKHMYIEYLEQLKVKKITDSSTDYEVVVIL